VTVIAAIAIAAVGSTYEGKSVRILTSETVAPKIDLAGAVSTAEQYMGGKAISAEYDQRNGQWVVDVQEFGDKKLLDIEVDAESGKVVAAKDYQEEREVRREQAC
jgi:uncharacterized membrane protein YkoI